MLITVFAAIIVLGILIFFHELGHFLAAKTIGVRVEKFSLGFGAKILGFKRGYTEYLVSAIPLGGYVKLSGENPKEGLSGAPWEFNSRSILERIAIVVAGPLMNLVLAILTFSLVYMYGIPALTTKIGEVKGGFPAWEAGLKAGEVIVAINGKEVKYWNQMTVIIHTSAGRKLKLTVEGEGKRREVEVVPKEEKVKNIFNEEVKVGLIGITPAWEFVKERSGPLESIAKGVGQTINVTTDIYKGILLMVKRKIKAEVAGPLGIVQMAGAQARVGLINLLFFLGIVSVNLAILNLLPVPILDGGQVLFLLIESLKGKPVSIEKRELIQQIGLIILVTLALFVTYRDILRMISGEVAR